MFKMQHLSTLVAVIRLLIVPPSVQAVRRVSMESCATRGVTVPTMDAATGPTGPVCVIPDCTDASATSVGPASLTSPDSTL